MKIFLKRYRLTLNFSIKIIALLLTFPVLLNSCTEDEALEAISKLLPVEDIELSREILDKVIYGPVKFKSDNNDMTVYNVAMSSVDFKCHQAPYSVIVVNGEVDGSYKVSKARILVDNEEIFNHTGFRMKVERLRDGVGFDENSIMKVEVTGEQGNYVNIYFIGEKEAQSEIVADYPFNGNTESESCSAPVGVEYGGVTLTDDRFCTPNSAYLFDGDNERLSFGAINDFYTLSLWFYNSEEITMDEPSGKLLQLDSGNPNGSGGISWGASTDQVDREIVTFSNSGSETDFSYWTNMESISVGWHHQVIVWDVNEEGYRLYLDNVDFGVGSVSGTPTYEKDFNNFEIGSNSGSWSGKVDDVKAYNYSLLAYEISDLYSEGGWTGYCSSCEMNTKDLNPIAYYPFSGNANDASINNNHGVVHGASKVSDRFSNPNSAYYFDGIDDYINFGSDTSLEVSGAISISVWLKPEEDSGYPQIISKEGEYKLSLYQNNRINFELANHSPGWKPTVISAIAEAHKWNHVALTYSVSSGKIYIYLNNVEVYNTAAKGTISDANPANNQFWIGFKSISVNGIDFFQGYIDDVRLFDVELSPCQVEALYAENGWTGD